MSESYDYREHLREIKALKARYSDDDTCAACGIIRERLPVGPLEPPDNGVCCVACLSEYPELVGMDRDQVAVWLWQNWHESLANVGGAGHKAAAVARAWLRVQAAQGRVDEGMADVAAAVFGLSLPTRDRLREYVSEVAAS